MAPIRYLVATLAGGAAQGWVRIESHAGVLRQITAVTPQWVEPLISTSLLVGITLGVGLVTAPRGALGAFCAYVLGIAFWVGLYLRPGPPGSSDVWGYEQWGYFIVAMLPTALIAVLLGALGSWLATRRARRVASQAGHA